MKCRRSSPRAAKAGAQFAGYVVLRLPWAVAPLFERWLDEHFPGRKEKVLGRIRSMRGNKLYDSRWGKRQEGEGIFAEQIGTMFEVGRRRAGISDHRPALSTAAFRRPTEQLNLL
jgi:DNA repair photolyase